MNEMQVSSTRAGLVLMTAADARQCADAIKADLGSARQRLLDLYEREGWRALGYNSWRDCAMAEFRQSQAYLYRQLRAAEVEREFSPIGEKFQPGVKLELSEAQARELSRLPSAEARAAVWEAAHEEHNGVVTAAHLHAAVNTKLGIPTPKPPPIRSSPAADDFPDYDQQDAPAEENWRCVDCGTVNHAGESCATCETNVAADEQDAELDAEREALDSTDEHQATSTPTSHRPFVMPEEEKESPEERVFYTLSRLRGVTKYPPSDVAAYANTPDLPSYQELATWMQQFVQALRTQATNPLRVVQ